MQRTQGPWERLLNSSEAEALVNLTEFNLVLSKVEHPWNPMNFK